MSKKIMLLTPFYEPTIGGAETFCKLLYQAAKDAGHRVSVCTCDQAQFVKNPFSGTGIKEFLRVFPELYRKARHIARDFDIIHAQGLISGLIAVLMKRSYGCKVYITMLALYDFAKKPAWFRALARWILLRTDLVFSEGKTGYEDLRSIHILSVPFTHWVEDRFFGKKYKIEAPDSMSVIFIGRDIPIKGRHIIEKVQYILNNRNIDFTIHSNLHHSILHHYLLAADVLVVPSLYSEGHTRIVCEAAAAGCAVITSNMGSLPEQVKDFGMAIPPKAKAFELVLSDLEANRHIVDHMKTKARKYAQEHFTKDNAKVFLREYE